MPRKSAAEIRRLTGESYSRFLQGHSYTAIGDELGITRDYVRKLVEQEVEARYDEHDEGYQDTAAIEVYRKIMREAWDRLATLRGATSLNVAGLLNIITRAQERIDKITGVESPTKIQNLGDIEVVWNDTPPGEPADVDLERLRDMEPGDFAD